jgi:hypothetical protein
LSWFLVKSVYGQSTGDDNLAGSLENLQKQVSNETNYQSELENFTLAHNFTYGIKEGKRVTIVDFDVSEMEHMVKSYMAYCQTTNAT